jgi:hypothetical protein
MPTKSDVLRLADIDPQQLTDLLAIFGLELSLCRDNDPVPGSYWGDDEAGLTGNHLFARVDTPLHSILHETCHYICVDPVRRRALDTNAGSDDAEESAVCYLQVLLAEQLESMGRERMFADMDRWGYSFRLGSSRAWFEQDAEDALAWLVQHDLIDQNQRPRMTLRKT